MCTKDFTRNNLSYFYSATNNTWDSSNQKVKISHAASHKFHVPLLFVSRQFVSLLLVFNNSSPLLFVSTTIRLHYYSSPLQFVSTTIRLQQFVSTTIRLHLFLSSDNSSPCDSSPLLFVSITIRLHYYSAQNNNWDWKFQICLFLHPTLSSALNIARYQQVTTIQIVFSLRCN